MYCQTIIKLQKNMYGKIDIYFIAAILVLSCSLFFVSLLDKPKIIELTRPFDEIPMIIGEWNGYASSLDEGTLKNAGVDHYIMRTYSKYSHETIVTYVGFYTYQEVGHTIHSPRHCYSGSGWEPISISRKIIQIDNAAGEKIEVNKMLVQNVKDVQVVYYWFQSRGRNITSEYWVKFYLIWDTIFRRRNDGSLVRISTAITSSEEEAEKRLQGFINKFYPHLMKSLPE